MRMCKTYNNSKKQGFTLIELLVVIAIISIIAAILFPVFATAREKGRGAACLSNLNQIGQAMMMYAADYDEGLPAWSEYYGQSYFCQEGTLSGTTCTASYTGDSTYLGYWQAKLNPYVKNGNANQNGAVVSSTANFDRGCELFGFV